MRVSFNLYNSKYSTYNNKRQHQVSMQANLPNFAEAGRRLYNMGNEANFNINNADKVLNIVNNGYLKKILSGIIPKSEYYLPQNAIDFITTFDKSLENVTDKKLINYITKELKEIVNKDFAGQNEVACGVKLAELSNITDAYNTLKGNYSRLSVPDFWDFTEIRLDPSLPKGYLDELKNAERRLDLFNSELSTYMKNPKKRNFSYPIKDFVNIQKFDPLANFTSSKNSKIENYIYEKYYLKSKAIPSAQRKILKDIFNNYGVKVVISDTKQSSLGFLKMVQNELNIWKTYSKGTAKFPPVLIATPINEYFANRKAMAYVNAYGSLFINPKFDFGTLNTTLRHEIMHLNEQKASFLSDCTSDKDIAKIVNSIIKSRTFDTIKGKKTVLDFDNCKYREEFLKAGISPYFIRYAYTNKSELLAVISEGDLSKCTDEFKNKLVKIGLPDYVLDMPRVRNMETEYNVIMVQEIMKEHPKAKTYDGIMKYYEE